MKTRKINKVKVAVVSSTLILLAMTPPLIIWCNTFRTVKTFGGEAFICLFPAMLYCLFKTINDIFK